MKRHLSPSPAFFRRWLCPPRPSHCGLVHAGSAGEAGLSRPSASQTITAECTETTLGFFCFFNGLLNWRRLEWIPSVTAAKGKRMNPLTRACVSPCTCAPHADTLSGGRRTVRAQEVTVILFVLSLSFPPFTVRFQLQRHAD